MNIETETKDWYKNYYSKSGANRNDLRTNKGVLFQTLASEVSLIKAARLVDDDPQDSLVLDVGCGSGGNIYQFLRLNYKIENITGIDILEERLSIARQNHPNANYVLGDASKMIFQDNSFDLVV